jgi:hypothetical protein
MIGIWSEGPAQTYHHATDLAPGHYNAALTAHGWAQTQSVLCTRYAYQLFDVVFMSYTQ